MDTKWTNLSEISRPQFACHSRSLHDYAQQASGSYISPCIEHAELSVEDETLHSEEIGGDGHGTAPDPPSTTTLISARCASDCSWSNFR